MKYIAIVLLETEDRAAKTKSYDETILSIEAFSEKEAFLMAERYGKSCETEYKNGLGEDISIRFLQIIDVNRYLREENEAVTELYSRHFENIESYRNFEKLYKK
ncbi:MAG: DUF4288 domain-containing protein [Capnocytophaga sp.]|nr:DUF4288 domain-containing protein [Capnocytophaga sp.]